MRDKFFTQKYCDRCRMPLKNGRTMSQFNTQCICMKCAEEERKKADYADAVEAEHAEIKKGNYNYKGIYEEENK